MNFVRGSAYSIVPEIIRKRMVIRMFSGEEEGNGVGWNVMNGPPFEKGDR